MNENALFGEINISRRALLQGAGLATLSAAMYPLVANLSAFAAGQSVIQKNGEDQFTRDGKYIQWNGASTLSRSDISVNSPWTVYDGFSALKSAYPGLDDITLDESAWYIASGSLADPSSPISFDLKNFGMLSDIAGDGQTAVGLRYTVLPSLGYNSANRLSDVPTMFFMIYKQTVPQTRDYENGTSLTTPYLRVQLYNARMSEESFTFYDMATGSALVGSVWVNNQSLDRGEGVFFNSTPSSIQLFDTMPDRNTSAEFRADSRRSVYPKTNIYDMRNSSGDIVGFIGASNHMTGADGQTDVWKEMRALPMTLNGKTYYGTNQWVSFSALVPTGSGGAVNVTQLSFHHASFPSSVNQAEKNFIENSAHKASGAIYDAANGRYTTPEGTSNYGIKAYGYTFVPLFGVEERTGIKLQKRDAELQ